MNNGWEGRMDSCHLWAVTDVCDTSHTCQSQLYLTPYQPAVVEAVKEGERGRLSTTGGWILWTWAWPQSEQVMWRTLRISSSSMDNRHFRTEWKFNLTNDVKNIVMLALTSLVVCGLVVTRPGFFFCLKVAGSNPTIADWLVSKRHLPCCPGASSHRKHLVSL